MHPVTLPENLADCKRECARKGGAPAFLAAGILCSMTKSKKEGCPLLDALVARLRAVQAELGKSDREMGLLVGASRGAWSNWVGSSNWPDETAMIRLCDKKEITMEWIYRGKLARMPPSLAIRLEMRVAGIDPDEATDAERGRIAERIILDAG